MGKARRPAWKSGVLSLAYDGADGIYRSLSIHFLPKPKSRDGNTAQFQVSLRLRESKQILVSLVIAESKNLNEIKPKPHCKAHLKGIQLSPHRTSDEWIDNHTDVRSVEFIPSF